MRIKFLQDRINGEPKRIEQNQNSFFSHRYSDNSSMDMPHGSLMNQNGMNRSLNMESQQFSQAYSPHSHLLTLNLLNQGILSYNPPGVLDDAEQKLLDTVMAFWG